MRLSERLRKLERLVADAGGCPACRDRRGRHVVVGSRLPPDGSEVAVVGWPAPCGRCGEVPELVIEVVEEVVEAEGDEGPS